VEKQSKVVPVSSKKGAISLSWDKLILEQVVSYLILEQVFNDLILVQVDPGTSSK
jgi:hypothetical protein